MSFTIGEGITVARVQSGEKDLCVKVGENFPFFFFFFLQRIVISARIVNWRTTLVAPAIKHLYALTSVRKTAAETGRSYEAGRDSFPVLDVEKLTAPFRFRWKRRGSRVKSGRLHRINQRHPSDRYGTITIVSSLSRVHGKDSA